MKAIMKKSLAGLLSVLMVCSLGACNSNPAKQANATSSNTADTQTGNLRINGQSWFWGKYNFDKLKTDFESKHKGVTVTYQKLAYSDTTTNMLQWATGKTDCDITLGGSREDAVAYVAKDYLIKFDDTNFFNGDCKQSNFVSSFLKLGDINGNQYVIPFCNEVFMINANKTLMAKAGLVDGSGKIANPETWDQLYTYAKKATIKKNGTVQTGLSIDWGTNDGFQSYMSSLQGVAGTLYGKDNATLDFTSSKASEVFTAWKKLIDGGYTPTDTFADQDAGRTNFKAGKVAMLIAPASRSIEAESLIGKGNVTTLPLPGSDKNGSFCYTQGIMVPKLSAHKTLAIQFIKEELLNNALLEPTMTKYGKLSPLLSTYEGKDQIFKDMLQIAQKSVSAPLYLDYNKLNTKFVTENQNYLKGGEDLKQLQSNLTQLESSLNLTMKLKS